MKKSVKLGLLGIAILMIVGLIIYSSVKPLYVKLTEIGPKDVNMYFIEEGNVISPENLEVYTEVQGDIIESKVVKNQHVNAGDTICVVDSSEYIYQKQQKESEIKGYQAQKANLSTQQSKEKDKLVTTKADLESQIHGIEEKKKSSTGSKSEQMELQQKVIAQNQTNLEWAKDNLEKTKILYDGGVMSENDYKSAQKELDVAESALVQSKQQLSVIESSDSQGSEKYYDAQEEAINVQIRGIDNQLKKNYTGAMSKYYDSLAQGSGTSIEELNQKIEDCNIKAPISGVIKELYIENTNVVNQTSPIVSIIREGVDEVEVFVSTSDIDYVKVGDKVELILERRDGDKTYLGTVREIDEEAIENVNALGVTEKSIKVKITPDDLKPFKTGYDVDVKFIFYNGKGKIAIPKTALFEDGEKDMVWVVRKGKLELLPVKKGVELQTEYVIDEGLTKGDYVVTDADTDGLKVGVKIKYEEK